MNYFEFCYGLGLVAVATAGISLVLLASCWILLFVMEQGKQLLNQFEKLLKG